MKRNFFCAFLMLLSFTLAAQVSVVHVVRSSFQVSPSALTQMTLLNQQSNRVQVIVESSVFNASQEAVLKVKTNPIWLKPGVNIISPQEVSFSQAQYGLSRQSEYIKNTHQLPSGVFRFCTAVYGITNTEALDNQCEDIRSDFSSFLVLSSPMNKDSIETSNPLLVWNHSEPFDILLAGEQYRLLLTKLKKGQTAEDAIQMNPILYSKNFLSTHQVQYPLDAPTLEKGAHYAWQIQKVQNNLVTNKSEAWEFIISKPKEPVHQKYLVLSKDITASFSHVTSSLMFIHFTEQYGGQELLNCAIRNISSKENASKVTEDSPINIDVKGTNAWRTQGQGRYVVDLLALSLKPGAYYQMEVSNLKGEIYYLNFFIENNAF